MRAKLARERGYLVAGSGEKGREERFRFYCNRCNERQPYVLVRMRTRYCSVKLDMLPPWQKLTEAQQDRAYWLLGIYSVPGAEVSIGPYLVLSTRVPVGRAEELAAQLVKLGREVAS